MNGDVHTRQKARVPEKGNGRLDGGIAVVGGHRTAGQAQAQGIAPAEHHPLVQGNGLHGHIQIMIAVGQQTHHIQ